MITNADSFFPNSRILGLDFGLKRIGLAISDPEQHIASPFKILLYQPKIFSELKNIFQEKSITGIVIGLPLNMNGSKSTQTLKTEEFASKLATHTSINILLWDERWSSKAIGSKKNQYLDDIAATYILQGVLEFLRNRKTL